MADADILEQAQCIAEGGAGAPNDSDFKKLAIALLSYIYAATGGASADGLAVLGYTVETTAGSVTAGKQSVSFNNVGVANATVLGTVLKPGKTVEFTGYLDPVDQVYFRLPAIAYNGTGTELAISTIE
jgi:hypothetical protein